jgi:sodium pump decarboxylase gamma subunit
MNVLLEVNPNETLGFFDALAFGGQTVLLGMGTVFSVLIIILIALVLFKVLLYDIPNKKSSEPFIDVEPTVAPEPPAVSSNDEIVAVIAAAIAMAESENSGAKFRVVSFRRK